jgi:hypothetical protein
MKTVVQTGKDPRSVGAIRHYFLGISHMFPLVEDTASAATAVRTRRYGSPNISLHGRLKSAQSDTRGYSQNRQGEKSRL